MCRLRLTRFGLACFGLALARWGGAPLLQRRIKAGGVGGTSGATPQLTESIEPSVAAADVMLRGDLEEALMTPWRDSMVDQPETDGAAYAAGWTLSGLVVLGAIVAVWILGI